MDVARPVISDHVQFINSSTGDESRTRMPFGGRF